MSEPKILVVFSSIFGANLALAEKVEAVLTVQGADVRVRGIPQVVLSQYETSAAKSQPKASEEDLEWADGYVFLSPVHSGMYAAAVKAFVDNYHEGALAGKFANKTFTGMITAELQHSGQEVAAAGLNDIAAIWGCLAVTPSTANRALNASDGNAFGLSFTLEKGKLPEGIDAPIEDHLTRFCEITKTLKGLAPQGADHAQEKASSPASPQTFAGNVGS